MSKKAILFNGPPGSGKDLAATMLHAHVRKHVLSQTRKFADPLKSAVHAAMAIPFSCEYYEGSFPGWKDEPQVEFFGHTPRSIYIAFSEDFMKPLFGKDIFGRIQARSIRQETVSEVFIYSDCGFAEEVRALALEIGPENCMLIELYRPGCSFAMDSRSYISDAIAGLPELAALQVRRFDNDQDKEWLRFLCKGVAMQFLGVAG